MTMQIFQAMSFQAETFRGRAEIEQKFKTSF
jgi:hypothetical protein